MDVTVEQVQVELRRVITDPLEVAWVEQAVTDLAMLVRLRYGDSAGAIPADVLSFFGRKVIAEQLASAARPDGAKAYQVQIDDGSARTEYFAPRSTVAVSDEWWSWLDAAAATDRSEPRGAFSVRLAGGPTHGGCGAW